MILQEKEYEFGRWKISGYFFWKIPLLYSILYRTQVGVESLDSFAKKHPKAIERLGKISLYICYLGFIALLFGLIYTVSLFFAPVAPAKEAVGVILPQAVESASVYFQVLEPVAQSKWVLLVPTLSWVISLMIIVLVHEGGHALIASSKGLKPKSTGVGFLGLIIPFLPIAFVEPDEKAFKELNVKDRAVIASAGPAMNIFMSIGILVLSILIGVLFNMHPLNNDILWWVFLLNIAVGTTNLLPIPKLDGSYIIEGIENKVVKYSLHYSLLVIFVGMVIVSIMR